MLVGSVVPMVVEQDGRWERSFDIYSRLLRERIVFLGQEVNDDIANLIAAQLLHLDAQDPGRDIYLYVNSPGGSAYAGMAIYDAMQYVQLGRVDRVPRDGHERGGDDSLRRRAGETLCAAEREDHDPPGVAGYRGTPADIQIAAREILSMTRRMAEIISRHTNQDVEQVMKDIDRDRFMTPEEAVDYGIVDAIMENRAAARLSTSRRARRAASDYPRNVFFTKNRRFAGRSPSRRIRYGYHSGPYGVATSTL